MSVVLLGFSILHGGLASLLAALQAWRVAHRYVGAHAPYEPAVLAQLWRFATMVFWISYLVLVWLPPAFAGARKETRLSPEWLLEQTQGAFGETPGGAGNAGNVKAFG